MTPTELDAIFRAWRDDWFAKNPDTDWRGNFWELKRALGFPFNSDMHARLFINRVIDAGLLHRQDYDYLLMRSPGQPFSFPDPPPLPASVPIPFPAGKALLEIINHSGGEGDIILV